MIMLLLPSKISVFLTIRLLVHADRIWQCSQLTRKRNMETLLVAHTVLEPFIQMRYIPDNILYIHYMHVYPVYSVAMFHFVFCKFSVDY